MGDVANTLQGAQVLIQVQIGKVSLSKTLDDLLVLDLGILNLELIALLLEDDSILVFLLSGLEGVVSHGNDLIDLHLGSLHDSLDGELMLSALVLEGFLLLNKVSIESVLLSSLHVGLASLNIVLSINIGNWANLSLLLISLIFELVGDVLVKRLVSSGTTISGWLGLVFSIDLNGWGPGDCVLVHQLWAVLDIDGSVLDSVASYLHVTGVDKDLVLEGHGVWAPVSVEGEDPHVGVIGKDEVLVVGVIDLDQTLIDGVG